MDKQELEIMRECLDGAEALIEECKNKIKLFESLKTGFQAQLAEAEKPKLKNGDVIEWIGLKCSNKGINIIHGKENPNGNLSQLNISKDTAGITSEHPPDKFKKHFNIFDLLKEISEPITKFKTDVHTYQINAKDFPHAPIGMAGNWFTIKEAREHCYKLFALIAEAERQAK